MSILGIDFGLKKIGLAIAEEKLPSPLGVIRNSSGVFSKIVKICQEKGVKKIVIGLSEGRLMPKIKKFAQRIAQESGLPVEFQDETLTSEEATAKMIAAGKKRQKRRNLEDAAAAACILEEYFLRKEAKCSKI